MPGSCRAALASPEARQGVSTSPGLKRPQPPLEEAPVDLSLLSTGLGRAGVTSHTPACPLSGFPAGVQAQYLPSSPFRAGEWHRGFRENNV